MSPIRSLNDTAETTCAFRQVAPPTETRAGRQNRSQSGCRKARHRASGSDVSLFRPSRPLGKLVGKPCSFFRCCFCRRWVGVALARPSFAVGGGGRVSVWSLTSFVGLSFCLLQAPCRLRGLSRAFRFSAGR